MVYYSERMQIEIRKGKGHIGQSPGETMQQVSSCILWVEAMDIV